MDTLLEIHHRTDKMTMNIVALADAQYVFKQLLTLRLVPAISALINRNDELLWAFDYAKQIGGAGFHKKSF